MKTAVQELIDDLLSGKITDTLSKTDYYLKKEKQQIIDAYFISGQSAESAEQYYNENYSEK